MNVSAEQTAIRLGAAEIIPHRHAVITANGETRLEPKVMAVLMRLLEADGATVSRHALIEDVWGEDAPSDEALTQAVSRLRRVIGDDPKRPRLIETVPKRGYRLIADPIAEIAARIPDAHVAKSPPTPLLHDPRALWAAILLLAAYSVWTSAAVFKPKQIEIVEYEILSDAGAE